MIRKNAWLWILLAAVAVYFGAMGFVVPAIGDDVWFLSEYRHRGSFVAFMQMMRATDNSRLTNAFYILVRAQESPLLNAVVYAALALALVAAAWVWWRHRLRPVAALTALVIVLFPWSSGTFSAVNFINVMLPSAALLWTLCLLRGRSMPLCAAILLCLVSGMVHEGYSVALACGLVAAAALRRLSKRQIVMVAAYCAGTLVVILAPGIWLRMGSSVYWGASPATVAIHLIPLLLCVAVLAASWHRRWSSADIVLGVATVVALAIAAKAGVGNPRTLWLPDFTASLLMLTAARGLIGRIPRWMWGVAGACVLAVCCRNVVLQHRAQVQELAIERAMAQTPNGTLFLDYRPVMSRWIVCCHWRIPLHLSSVNIYRPAGHIFTAVPGELRHISAEAAAAINAGRDPGPEFTRSGRGWRFCGLTVAADSVVTEHDWAGTPSIPVCIDGSFRFVNAAGTDTLRWIP